jgi:1,4-alpha-glucan branching enzyme
MTSIRPDGRVEFRFFRPNATEVKVLGTFNNWEGDSLVLDNEGEGWWSGYALLTPGEYRFRYWADGHWYTDFASHGVEMAQHGWNSVLLVPDGVVPMRLTDADVPQYAFGDDIAMKPAA